MFQGGGSIDSGEFMKLMSTLGMQLTMSEAEDLLNEAQSHDMTLTASRRLKPFSAPF